MQWVGKAELVTAVAEAGGLGMLTALTFPDPAALRAEIEKVQANTDKPFGVNLTILPSMRTVNHDELRETIVDAGVRIIETAGANPGPYMDYFNDNGVQVIHKCTSVRHALKRSEEQTYELQSLMRISYAVFCLKKKKTNKH